MAEVARHNFAVLKAGNIKVVNASAEDFMASTTEQFDLIFIDPSRRKGDKKVFRFEDASPDLAVLQTTLVKRAGQVLIKAEPLMDIRLAIEQLTGVEEAIVLAVNNEVKEVLFRLKQHYTGPITARASNIKDTDIDVLDFNPNEEKQENIEIDAISDSLYEPNAAIMKSGAFKTVARKFNLLKLHRNTHLYTSRNHSYPF